MRLAGLTIFLAAFLLFQVQPVISKAILPWFGGSAGVWTACQMFFQLLLLGGYAYAHWLQGRPAVQQRRIHVTLVAASLVLLPILPPESAKPSGGEDPVWGILQTLARSVGLPFFLLSSTSPLIQVLAVRAGHGLPWRLFALSNAASLAALLTYPFLVEPALALPLQSWVWTGAYAVYAALIAAVVWKGATAAPAVAESEAPRPGIGRHIAWGLYAACASILLLSVTAFLTQDVAAIPFLWVLPLAIYLFTFILCFEFDGLYQRILFYPPLIAALYGFAYVLDQASDWSPTVGANLTLACGALFICCMVCHGELAAMKPEPAYLTRYYLAIAAGGAAGGLFVGVVAPIAFRFQVELPLGLWLCGALACAGLAMVPAAGRWRQAGVVAALAALGVYGGMLLDMERRRAGRVDFAERNFYGHLHIFNTGQPGEAGAARQLVHGQIMHGQQLLDPARRMVPTSYFCPMSGAGRAATARPDGVPQHVGVVGLGCGALLGYARPGDQYRLYEINPLILKLARSHFTFLPESPARVTEILGDARLSLEREPPQQFDLLYMDAFSGDAIPVHLVTREAFALYARHLKPDGILVVNMTNRYIDLRPVVAAAAAGIGRVAVEVEDDPDSTDLECYTSHYALITSRERIAREPNLQRNAPEVPATPGFREWTDAYSNLWSIVRR